MKTTMSILFLAALSINTVQAADLVIKPYVRIDGGYSFVKDLHNISTNSRLDNMEWYKAKFTKSSHVIGAGLGLYLSPNFRSDFTISYRPRYRYYSDDNTIAPQLDIRANQKIKALSFMLSSYFDLPLNDNFTPYLSAGVGITRVLTGDYVATSVKSSGQPTNTPLGKYASFLGQRKNNFSYSAGLGFKTKILSNLSADFSYKYMDMGRTFTQYAFVNKKTGESLSGNFKSKLTANEYSVGLRYDF